MNFLAAFLQSLIRITGSRQEAGLCAYQIEKKCFLQSQKVNIIHESNYSVSLLAEKNLSWSIYQRES